MFSLTFREKVRERRKERKREQEREISIDWLSLVHSPTGVDPPTFW